MKRVLKGITWDHPRGFDPLARGAALFEALQPDISIKWQRRSLSSFGDEPIDSLTARFDLVVIDHPFCGHAAATGCLLDLSQLLPTTFIDSLAADSVGPSMESYRFGGALWALPTDAAAQVAAYRADLLQKIDADVPRRFSETLALARTARSRGLTIAQPLCPGDAACTMLSLLANHGCRLDENGAGIDVAAAGDALDAILELKKVSHQSSVDWNPIQTYDAMARGSEIVYVPFVFGYSNYAREGRDPALRFTNVAGPGADPTSGSLLGGAGCAISASCRDVDAALTYLRFVHDAEHQRGPYFDLGGQPGLRSAWTDERVNRLSHRFFADTLQTLDKSFRRPRFRGFVPFLARAGLAINHWLREGGDRRDLVDTLRRSYDEARS